MTFRSEKYRSKASEKHLVVPGLAGQRHILRFQCSALKTESLRRRNGAVDARHNEIAVSTGLSAPTDLRCHASSEDRVFKCPSVPGIAGVRAGYAMGM
jgi:hypothetical protein